jgi:hypothetical protein
MTPIQKNIVKALLFVGGGGSFHHGDCIGADAEAHDIASELLWFTVSHPPDNNKARAHKKCDYEREPKPYLERNRDIVDHCDLMIAAPDGLEEQLRSGTWATTRYAKKTHTNTIIIYPNGNTELVG